MMRVFIGYDRRVAQSYNVMAHSIARHASAPVALTPLIAGQLPITRFGLTEFTYSRFLVPWLCGYEGWALFVDPDMVVRDDITKLFDHANGDDAVKVNKEQPRFEWASAMLFNCAQCTALTPEWINDARNDPMRLASWAHTVGAFPPEWNHCVGYVEPDENAKLLHFTAGVPGFPEIDMLPFEGREVWHAEAAAANHICSWRDLMGQSVHARQVIDLLTRHYAGEYDANQ